jgi:hypothetical protein
MLTTYITIWVITIIFVLIHQWQKSIASIGIPFAFIFSMAFQYFFGAVTNIWYDNPEKNLILLGLEQVTYGVMAFAIGSIIIAPTLARRMGFSWLKVPIQKPDLGFAQAYIYLGLIFSFVFIPLLGNIPSVRAVVTSGSNLLLIGLCLSCWNAWLFRDDVKLLSWLILMGLLPIVTIFTGGYASGAPLLVFVLSFVLWFYRPRVKAIIALLLAIYFGLSLFVTYYRDRGEIRDLVWGGSGAQSRVDKLIQSATTFEFFDPVNIRHLHSINERLNENKIVGEAVAHMAKGTTEYAQGQTILSAFYAMIPRILWPGKPSFFGGWQFYAKYTGANTRELMATSSNTSIAVGLPFEFYINFGTVGVVLGYLVLGTLFRLADLGAAVRLLSGDYQGFMSWYLPTIGAIVSSNDLAELISTTSALIVLVFILNRVRIPRFMKGKNARVGV